MNWVRVNRFTKCPICDHDSWCAWTEDGRSVKCMRVQSDRPTSDGGWMHNLSGGVDIGASGMAISGNRPRLRFKRYETGAGEIAACSGELAAHHSAQTLLKMLTNWQAHQNGQLEPFAATLGVSRMALESLGCVWASDHRAAAFPMRDGQGRVIGIRLRNDLGRKWAVRGSKQGLFYNLSGDGRKAVNERELTVPSVNIPLRNDGNARPSSAQTNLPAVPVLAEPEHLKLSSKRCESADEGEARESNETDKPATDHRALERGSGSNSRGGGQTILIVEGPTDAAAAIDLGYAVIGRPACLGCEDMIAEVVKRLNHGLVFIVADADDPGQRGATKLQAKLRKARIVTLPCKDLRAFKNAGGDQKVLNEILNAAL